MKTAAEIEIGRMAKYADASVSLTVPVRAGRGSQGGFAMKVKVYASGASRSRLMLERLEDRLAPVVL